MKKKIIIFTVAVMIGLAGTSMVQAGDYDLVFTRDAYYSQVDATTIDFIDYSAWAGLFDQEGDDEYFLNATMQTPTTPPSVKMLTSDSPDSWSYMDWGLENLLEYPNGSYNFTLTWDDYTTELQTVNANGSFPVQIPLITNMLPGAATIATPTFEWNQWTTADLSRDVVVILVSISNVDTDDMVFETDLDYNVDSITLTDELEAGNYSLLVRFHYGDESPSETNGYVGAGYSNGLEFDFTVVPEPATMSLFVLAGLVMVRKKNNSGKIALKISTINHK